VVDGKQAAISFFSLVGLQAVVMHFKNLVIENSRIQVIEVLGDMVTLH
jgi:hypothetical protein